MKCDICGSEMLIIRDLRSIIEVECEKCGYKTTVRTKKWE